ncbi:hypothetical protein [Nocardia sp. A7]|uniref:hypothetical protein n=1 Tax=Nocardia sp. A7 TaxID=2789274 RepID=UPI00397C4D24
MPEPLVLGGQMMHLLEQAPVAGRIPEPTPDAALIDLIQAVRTPLDTRGLARAQQVAFSGPRHDPPAARAVLHDHLIEEPWGLDVDDPAELTRLRMLPERRIGVRRIDDFQAHSVRQAMAAVYQYFAIDQRIPLVYHGFADPRDGWFALRASAA